MVTQLCRKLGITRLADLTGLDRCGVRVCAAVRPLGHLMQVSTGKGAHADVAAVAEAAELWAAEQVESERWVWLDGVAHVRAARLDTRGERWIPAESVWCPPAGAPSMGRHVAKWVSNGMGAHRVLSRALLHGLLEAIERHALTVTLPRGWLEAEVRGLCVPPPIAAPKGFRLLTFDLTPPGCPVAVAGALLEDLDRGPIPLTAGYAARLTADAALRAACEEAFQSRLTDVQGAREDILVDDSVAAPSWLSRIRPRAQPVARRASSSPQVLARALGRPCAWVELVPGELPLRVVKVVVDGYRISPLLGGPVGADPQ